MARKTKAAQILIILALLMIGGSDERDQFQKFDEYVRKYDSIRSSAIQSERIQEEDPISYHAVQPKPKDISNQLPSNSVSRGGEHRISAGVFVITAYTAGEESTGKSPGDPAYGQTASGVMVEEGITIAADWSVLPKGTIVWIEGVGRRVVQDKGGAIKGFKIDLYMPNLDDAKAWGRQKRKVFILQ